MVRCAAESGHPHQKVRSHMKKILTLLFVSLIMISLPLTVFAQEDTEVSNAEEASVTLFANIASRYTVRLPASVDVSNESTVFYVQAKGSIAADRKLDITCSDTGHTLIDETATRSYALSVNVDGGSFSADELTDMYQDDLKAEFTVAHASLSAGNYRYNLPILISLNSVS